MEPYQETPSNRSYARPEDLIIDIEVFNTNIGDTFLLCSDGLYNAVDTQKISDFFVFIPLCDEL